MLIILDQKDYKRAIYWDNGDKTQRCFTKDCNERDWSECRTLRDINRSPEVRCGQTNTGSCYSL